MTSTNRPFLALLLLLLLGCGMPEPRRSSGRSLASMVGYEVSLTGTLSGMAEAGPILTTSLGDVYLLIEPAEPGQPNFATDPNLRNRLVTVSGVLRHHAADTVHVPPRPELGEYYYFSDPTTRVELAEVTQ